MGVTARQHRREGEKDQERDDWRGNSLEKLPYGETLPYGEAW
jgi:hypothetical protein